MNNQKQSYIQLVFPSKGLYNPLTGQTDTIYPFKGICGTFVTATVLAVSARLRSAAPHRTEEIPLPTAQRFIWPFKWNI